MASRSAAAEARRRRILERGGDRLNRITSGKSEGVAILQLCGRHHEACPEVTCLSLYGRSADTNHVSRQPDGSIELTSLSAVCLNLVSERQPRPEPQQTPDAHNHASTQQLHRDAAHREAIPAEGHGKDVAHIQGTPQETEKFEQDTGRKTAHPAVQCRSDSWAQLSSSGAESAQGLQRESAVLLGSRQVGFTLSLRTAHFICIICKQMHGHLDVKWSAYEG